MGMTNYDLLSTSPPDEQCVQTDGTDVNRMLAYEEGKRYIELIRKVCGKEPDGVRLKVRSNPHDLGTYYTVALFFDDEIPEHVDYMEKVDGDGPLNWDDATEFTIEKRDVQGTLQDQRTVMGFDELQHVCAELSENLHQHPGWVVSFQCKTGS